MKNGQPKNTVGSWLLGVPVGGGIGDLSPQAAVGTITLVDNTSPRTPPPGQECDARDKTDCGTSPLLRAKVKGEGYNRRQLIADLSGVEFGRKGGGGAQVRCHIGQVTIFGDGLLVSDNRRGDLLLVMPSASTVARRRILNVTGASHKVASFKDCGSGEGCSDDVTRHVTITFKRL